MGGPEPPMKNKIIMVRDTQQKNGRQNTTQRPEPVAPTDKVTPAPNWSHLERLMTTSIQDGASVLLTRTSPYAKCRRGSNPASDGTTASPIRRKAKKHRVDAAHNITASARNGNRSHVDWSRRSISGVIGSLVRRGLPARFRRAPFNTYWSCDMLVITGSPTPMAICAYRTAAR